MSLLQTLQRCAFALCCNLLFQFLPAVPCPSPNSLRDLLVLPVFPLQVCPCPWSCHAPASPTAVSSLWGKLLGIDWEAAAPDKDELPCLCSDRMEQGLCSLPRWQAWLKLGSEVHYKYRECLREKHSSGTHGVTGSNTDLHPLPGKPCSTSWGQAASQTHKPGTDTQGMQQQHHTSAGPATGDTQPCSLWYQLPAKNCYKLW